MAGLTVGNFERLMDGINIPVPASGEEAVIFRLGGHKFIVIGDTVPSDEAVGYAPGGKFLDYDGATVSKWYTNIGTAASCDFNLDTTAA